MESLALNRWRGIMFRMYENWWKQHQNGILDDEVFIAYSSHMRITLSLSGSIDWWLYDRTIDYIPGFVEYVDVKISEWKLR